jgi:pimeloyl-ACP methyl ester carboxylesterase
VVFYDKFAHVFIEHFLKNANIWYNILVLNLRIGKIICINITLRGRIMSTKSKRIKLMILAITLLILCTAIGILKHREHTYATRTIETSIVVGKDNIYVNCCGKGKPTVIFESGSGGTNLNWSNVQPEISKITRTFSYNRIEEGRTTLDQVHELHTLLADAKVKGPYIIVAHSIAGLNARLFAGTYPNEVAGIIFVDSSHENQFANPKIRNGTPAEEMNILDTDANQVKEIRKKDALRNIPIIVLTADHSIGKALITTNADWTNYQNDIASLSNKSKHIIVSKSSHFIQDDHPDVVIDAVKEMIKEVKR